MMTRFCQAYRLWRRGQPWHLAWWLTSSHVWDLRLTEPERSPPAVRLRPSLAWMAEQLVALYMMKLQLRILSRAMNRLPFR